MRVLTVTCALVFEDGLYSLSDIRAEISNNFQKPNLNDSALDVVGIGPTQKCRFIWDIQGKGYGIILYFLDANSIGKLLGFNATDVSRDKFYLNDGAEQAHFKSNTTANLLS